MINLFSIRLSRREKPYQVKSDSSVSHKLCFDH